MQKKKRFTFVDRVNAVSFYVWKHGTVTVNQIAEHFNVSKTMVHKYLAHCRLWGTVFCEYVDYRPNVQMMKIHCNMGMHKGYLGQYEQSYMMIKRGNNDI